MTAESTILHLTRSGSWNGGHSSGPLMFSFPKWFICPKQYTSCAGVTNCSFTMFIADSLEVDEKIMGKRRFIINRHRKLRTLKFILHSLFVVFFFITIKVCKVFSQYLRFHQYLSSRLHFAVIALHVQLRATKARLFRISVFQNDLYL